MESAVAESRFRAMRILILAFAVPVCIKEPSIPTRSSKGRACQILTQAEIQKITGVPMMAGRSRVDPAYSGDSDGCFWLAQQNGRPGKLILTIEDLDAPAGAGQIGTNFAWLKAEWLRTNDVESIAIPGLGDEAFYQERPSTTGPVLMVRHRAQLVLIQGEQPKEACIELARLVLQRM